MPALSGFALPEVDQAFAEWRALTGFGWGSAEWSDTLAALDRLDLLAADQAPQPDLWTTDDELAELPAARRLRLAILGAARVWHDHGSNWRFDLPTTAEIMVAFLASWPAEEVDEPPLSEVLLRLEVQVPRQTARVFACRTDALAALIAAELHEHGTENLGPLTRLLVRDAVENDTLAGRMFDRLPASEYGITLLPLSDGRWVMAFSS